MPSAFLHPFARPAAEPASFITIVRGAVPLALFGTSGYGAVLGMIATPVLIINAASPTLFAMIVDRWGWPAAQAALVASCAAC